MSTPIAGVIGFAIQLRQIRKTRLENEKLQLEIENLRKAMAKSERQIVIPTNDEVQRFLHMLQSRILLVEDRLERNLSSSNLSSSRSHMPVSLISTITVVSVIYLVCAAYGLYRLTVLIISLFN